MQNSQTNQAGIAGGPTNQKIKLPIHLQIDAVSPATRLLEKRRLMYEVQKAFDDQKEDFKQ